ncbi:calcyphosin-2 [Astyanax mexicanus]|uniref:Calcyphosin-2 n=2 Tax=Astyanax mexicanus TaxID=7994 RepID=A0A8T2LQ82_ASTMX|nr:calcyphosin-2 [Astyanax mexicanus]XP_022535263.1 calcyphosin-2 [Astyanax mexicanus]KAG9272997.1 calcyphosin-2 [Astyanax mexicanus]
MDQSLNVRRTFTPQRQTASQTGGGARGQRPKEVPVLQLDRLGDREEEEEEKASFITVAGNPSLSALSWGTAVSARPPQKWVEGTENITERNASLLRYQESPQSSHRGYPLSRPPSSHRPNQPVHLTPCSAELNQIQTNTIHSRTKKLEAEGLTVEKRKQAVIEQMMVDQLSRAVISDPEQNATNQFNASARHRRTLHHTMVKTPKSLTENLLSHKLCFQARILSRCGREGCRELIGFFFNCDRTLTVYEYRSFGKNRCSALPFIARGVYRTRGRPYCLYDISQGADLRFSTDMPHLSDSLRQRPYLTLRVTDVDEETKQTLLTQSGDSKQYFSEEEINDHKTLRAIQAAVRNRLKGHAIQTLIGLGRRLQSLDVNENGLIQKEKLRECLAEELSLSRQDSEAVWRIVGQQEEPLMDYAEMMRAVTGEMSEIRKAIFMKVYVKLDPNKTGSVSLSDIEKFYSATPSQHLEFDVGTKMDFLTCVWGTGRVTRDVSYGEFEDYYEGLSIEVPTDQEYIDILKSTWSI